MSALEKVKAATDALVAASNSPGFGGLVPAVRLAADAAEAMRDELRDIRAQQGPDAAQTRFKEVEAAVRKLEAEYKQASVVVQRIFPRRRPEAKGVRVPVPEAPPKPETPPDPERDLATLGNAVEELARA